MLMLARFTSASNDSTAPLKFLATLVVEKGKPAVTPAP